MIKLWKLLLEAIMIS